MRHPDSAELFAILLVGAAVLVIAVALSGCGGTAFDPVPVIPSVIVSVPDNTATLSWEAPTTNTDGTPLTDLTGYRIDYSEDPFDLSYASVDVPNAQATSEVIGPLPPGTWYFAVEAVNSQKVESTDSSIVSKVLP